MIRSLEKRTQAPPHDPDFSYKIASQLYSRSTIPFRFLKLLKFDSSSCDFEVDHFHLSKAIGMIRNKECPMNATTVAAIVAVFLLLFSARNYAQATSTTVGFYRTSCPRAEAIILETVRARFNKDKTITPALLRMFFHDCFVMGCDASILIDSTPGNPAEKEAGPNLSVRGFDFIDQAKAALEAECPGIVSCADIIAVSVRDAVALAGGPNYTVGCGRRDGLISKLSNVDNLPSPSFSIDQVKVAFQEKGLTLTQLVALLGAHTVGSALCGFFSDRIFSFHGTGLPDPAMNATLATTLGHVCPNPFTTETNVDPAVALDQRTPQIFDSSYFAELQAGNGILEVDQELMADVRTSVMVEKFRDERAFFGAFVEAILAMGEVQVKVGVQGEVRKRCNQLNPPPKAAAPPSTPASPPTKQASPPSKPVTGRTKPASPPTKRASPPPNRPSSSPKLPLTGRHRGHHHHSRKKRPHQRHGGSH